MADPSTGRGYVSSARILSFLLLLLTVWALTEAPHRRARDLFKARRHFVRLVKVAHDVLYPEETAGPFVITSPGRDAVDCELHGGDLPSIEVKGTARSWTMPLSQPCWSEDIKGLVEIAERWRILPIPPLRDRARYSKKTDDFGPIADLYDNLESNLLVGRKVKVPTIDYRFDSDYIVVVIAMAVFLVLLAIRSRLRWLVERQVPGRGEPWLILDAESGLEYIAGVAWTILIMISPLIVATSLVMFQAVEFIAGVRAHMFLMNLAWVGFTLVFLVVGCAVSAKTVALLIRLRHLRMGSEAQAE